jgi:isoquinoline 1-oxidoreductase beta subunit
MLAWTTRVAGPGIWRQNRPVLVADGLDYMAVEGLGESYPVAHQSIAWAETEPHAKIGFWRGVGASHNVAFTEAFVDELAEAAGADPIAYRLGLLDGDGRAQAVLRRVAAMCGWRGPRTARGGRGVAFYQSRRWQTRVAQVVEVEQADGLLRPTRVWCAVDSGVIVNPAQAEAQLQGAALFGLSAALWGEITFDGGTPQQSSFADYRVLQLGDAPPVEVAFIEGGEGFGSIGEIGAPAAPAALLNAAWAATGRRVRRLPLARAGLA